MKLSFSLFITLYLICGLSFNSYSQIDSLTIAQESSSQDSIPKVSKKEMEKKRRLISFIDGSSDLNEDHSPKKAAIYSALLPGLGQVYNKRYWKLPILYGLGGLLVYQMVQTHREYVLYRDALFLLDISQLPDSNFDVDNSDLIFRLGRPTIETRKDTFRRSRDRFILWSTVLYALNIVDAIVDAHLVNFDTNRKLVKITPELLPSGQAMVPGINLQLNF